MYYIMYFVYIIYYIICCVDNCYVFPLLHGFTHNVLHYILNYIFGRIHCSDCQKEQSPPYHMTMRALSLTREGEPCARMHTELERACVT